MTIDFNRLIKNLPPILPEQQEKASKIIDTVSLLVEQEYSHNLDLFEIDLDTFSLDNQYYQVELKPTELGKYLTIKAKEGTLLIESIGDRLLIAEGIIAEDLDYWQQVQTEINEQVQPNEKK